MKFHGYEPIYEETDDHQNLDKVVKLTEDMIGDVSRTEIICGRKAPLLGASFVPKKVRGYWMVSSICVLQLFNLELMHTFHSSFTLYSNIQSTNTNLHISGDV